MVQAFQELTEAFERLTERFYGVTVGTVANVLDPLMLGRVQVTLPAIDSVERSPWARIAVPMAGLAHGFYCIPNVGDEVLVAFESGDIRVPYVIGSLWTAMAPPPLPSPLPQIRMIRTIAGNQIMFTETPATITVMAASGETITLSPAGIQILAGSNVINMTPDGISIAGNMINLVGTSQVNISAPTVNVTSTTQTTVGSTGTCSVTAPMVRINS